MAEDDPDHPGDRMRRRGLGGETDDPPHMRMLRYRFGAMAEYETGVRPPAYVHATAPIWSPAEDHSDRPGDWMRQLRLGGEKDVRPPVNEHDAASIRSNGRR